MVEIKNSNVPKETLSLIKGIPKYLEPNPIKLKGKSEYKSFSSLLVVLLEKQIVYFLKLISCPEVLQNSFKTLMNFSRLDDSTFKKKRESSATTNEKELEHYDKF